MLSVRLWLGKRLFGEIGSGFLPAGTRVSPKRWIKWSKAPEVEALEFVAANTKISVPKVYKTFTRDGYLLVEMEYVKGEPITKNWRNLTLDQKRSLMEELGGYLRQLKDLKPPEGCLISSTQGGPCSNVRIGRRLFGPFKTVDAFHECLRGGTALDDPAFNENMELVHSRPYEIRYTHSDISISNILYPEYWEYTRAHYNHYDFPDLYEMLWEQMDRYDEELKAERRLWRVFDQPLDQPQG